jgi:6-phosphogluconolactonase/glucosamine-6-phosphate isomerase/deaminase
MRFHILETAEELGRAAAAAVAEQLRRCVEARGTARLVLATSNSHIRCSAVPAIAKRLTRMGAHLVVPPES